MAMARYNQDIFGHGKTPASTNKHKHIFVAVIDIARL
jgi:hypothetical protein